MSGSQHEPVPASRNELGDFLRSRREKLRPELTGIGNGRRRRTPGLRARGRRRACRHRCRLVHSTRAGTDGPPSESTVDALAGALQLSNLEHAHLRALAQNQGRASFCREIVPQNLVRMVQALSYPAYITGRRWDLLAWNNAAIEIFADFARIPVEDRNILVQMLTAPEMKLLFGQAWAREARRMLGLFRATYDLWAGDLAFCNLLERLRSECAQFETWWEEHDLAAGAGVEKLLYHPRKGPLRFETATFQANEDPALRLAIYTPA